MEYQKMTGTSEKSGKPMETNEIHDVEFLEFENFSKFYEVILKII